MEIEKREKQELDILVLFEDFLRQAKRTWVLGMVLILMFGGAMAFLKNRTYSPIYEAYASFMVRVANPLYTNIGTYNEKTAQVMADTFPSILTSDLLQQRVMEELDLTYAPAFAVSASSHSSIFTLKVRDANPQRAYDVLNAVITCYPEVAEFVVGSTILVLLDESGIPDHPVASFNLPYHFIRGAVMGGILWCGILLFLALIKNTIHTDEELRTTLNTPCLGQIPTVQVTKKMPYPLMFRFSSDSSFSESFRLLRLRLESTLQETGEKILLVSSAIPGEGKTTVSTNLSVCLTLKGKRVLLIDCDLRNPSVANALSSGSRAINREITLAKALADHTDPTEMIQQTNVNNLFVVLSGSGNKSDTFGKRQKKQMTQLLQKARNQFDYIILDTPPCSLLSDASEIADLADAGLVVIRQDYATKDQILDGVQQLADCKLPIIGCVFNNVRKGLSGSYGYGYGYSYGYGSNYGKKYRS